MGSTSFLGFSCPNLLLVFLNMFLKHVTYFFGAFLWVCFYFFLFLILDMLVTTEIRFFALKCKEEKLLDRGQNGF